MRALCVRVVLCVQMYAKYTFKQIPYIRILEFDELCQAGAKVQHGRSSLRLPAAERTRQGIVGNALELH